jgi:hypothetical protein
MWARGDKAPAIAAAFGCKVGVINVARARFGLKPRRTVAGRPKKQQEREEPSHQIKRVAVMLQYRLAVDREAQGQMRIQHLTAAMATSRILFASSTAHASARQAAS